MFSMTHLINAFQCKLICHYLGLCITWFGVVSLAHTYNV